jgi:hypothetical protein
MEPVLVDLEQEARILANLDVLEQVVGPQQSMLQEQVDQQQDLAIHEPMVQEQVDQMAI